MRRPQPPLGYRRMRVDGTLKCDLCALGIEDAHHGEYVGVCGFRGNEQLQGDGSGDLGLRLERVE